ncbi:hypothetical protein [Flavobacterium terrigena]|uniref:MetA-pathway of phenol degradation n=1 Tax=Flavobacterium terrigena TaxID=402734 RepID=A0A1H6QGQ4_9FLAO|nr:hypothetical protein [Flavobacterium terrigena]SEI42878.1 hypothetical protein SAMN05660918_0513 [Flavobacterium terrigena]
MKKNILILVSCLFTLFGYSQVPSINTNTNFVKERGAFSKQNKIDDLFENEIRLKNKLDKTSKILLDEQNELDKLIKRKEKKIDKKDLQKKEEEIQKKEEEIKKIEVNIQKKEKLINKLKVDTTTIGKNLDKVKIEFEIEAEMPQNFFYKSYNDHYNGRGIEIDNKIKKLKNDIIDAKSDENTNRMNKYKDEIQVLNNEKLNLSIERVRVLSPKVNHYNAWFPTWDEKYRNAFFEDVYNNTTGKANFLNAFSVVGNPKGITGQSEIVADKIQMLRVTFGTVISASNDSLTNTNTQVDALQRLINGGGNFYFDGSLPFLTTIKGNDENELLHFYSFLNAKVAADIKGYGNNLDASTYNSSVGFNCYGDMSSENKKFNFFLVTSTNFYWASTKEFYDSLGIDHNHGFLSGKLTIGVTLLNQFRFSANVLTFGSEEVIRSSKIGFGLQFLPNL